MTTPRLGAAAAWVPGEGLVVVGGNAGGTSTAAGAEVFLQGSTGSNFSALAQFPSDPSIGAGAAPWADTQHVLVAGGITPTGQDAGVRVLTLSGCTSNCIKTWASLPVPLTSASTFVVLPAGSTYPALVVGSELASGLTHTYLLNSTSATEVHTKVPHYNASAIQSPVGFGAVLLFGGADAIEQFFPPQSGPG